MSDRQYMARALKLAAKGLYSTSPNPRVGCVLVKDGQIIGEGFHHKAGGPHAEIHALNQAGEAAQGATAYVTLEPCAHHGKTPPCSQALITAGVARVVCAIEDPNPLVAGQGIAQLREAGIDVQAGLLETEAEQINIGFIHRMKTGRPWVRVKIAQSVDGRTAMASGESKWITGPDARRDVQRLRARSCAILTGVGTVRADNPELTVRPAQLGFDPGRSPLRVVLDNRLETESDMNIVDGSAPTLIVTTADADSPAAQGLRREKVEVVQVTANAKGRAELDVLLDELGRRQINELLVECGGKLSGAFLKAGLVDELVVYTAPKLLGSEARPMARLPLESMDEAIELELQDLRQIGTDIRTTYRMRK